MKINKKSDIKATTTTQEDCNPIEFILKNFISITALPCNTKQTKEVA